MQIESSQLAAALVTGAAAFVTVATVPAGERWILKTQRLRMYAAGAPTQVAVSVLKSGGPFVLVYDELTATGLHTREGWDVLAAGDKLEVYAAAGEFVRYLASGTVLVEL